MKKLLLITFFFSLLFLPSVFATEVTVAEDCWMEQQVLSGFPPHWHWVKRDCSTMGFTGKCRIECSYEQLEEFDPDEYYTKDEIGNMFEGVFDYLHANYYKKSVVNILFFKVWKLNKRVGDVEDYISSHEAGWSEDKVGGGGISSDRVGDIIENAINWLKGIEKHVNDYEEKIANVLSSYFVNWDEYWRLKEKVTVMNDFLAVKFGKEYCDYEAYRLINDFGWEEVKCGDTTYYANEGNILGITPV